MDNATAKQKFNSAAALYKQGSVTEALRTLQELRDALPENKELLYASALCLIALGRESEALLLAEKLKTIYADPRGDQLRERLLPWGLQPNSIAPSTDPPTSSQESETRADSFWHLDSASRAFALELELLEDGAMIVFGPFAQEATVVLRRGIDALIITRQSLDNVNILGLPHKEACGLSLIFAHYIPSRKGKGKSDRIVQEWAAQLLNGAGFSPAAYYDPDIEWFGDDANDRVFLKLFWLGRMNSYECLFIARRLENSFIMNGGESSNS